jgi:hypothetical protein
VDGSQPGTSAKHYGALFCSEAGLGNEMQVGQGRIALGRAGDVFVLAGRRGKNEGRRGAKTRVRRGQEKGLRM